MTQFDSSTVLLRALAAALRGQRFMELGLPPAVSSLGRAADRLLPAALRHRLYALGGQFEAVPAQRLHALRAEDVSRWVASLYPARRYPAVLIGSSNGAAVHLAAALGIPWLPQTFLSLVESGGIDPDDAEALADAGARAAPALLDHNPDLQLHHMQDPVQDRLMSRRALYFRFKRRRLGAAYECFLCERLQPGGVILLLDCGLRWPVRRIGARHVFQFGGVGATDPWEYIRGGPRVAAFLARHGSRRRAFHAPEPDAEAPEAEWGFAPELARDVERFAAARGLFVRRIAIPTPEALSAPVADLHRRWYARHGEPERARHLLVESFFLVDPWWAMCHRYVPFWTVFNTECSAEALERYLDATPAFEEIRLSLFSHGTASIGLADVARFSELLARATGDASFVGARPSRYPSDFGAPMRFHRALERIAHGGRPPPPALTLGDLEELTVPLV